MTQSVIVFSALFIVAICSFLFYYNDVISKFIAVLLLVLLANGVYFMFDGVKGWPTENTREVKGMLASVTIVNPTRENEGAIYVSIFPETPPKWYEYSYHRKSPRLFYVKYSNDRAAKFEEAKQALEEGKQVRINGIPSESSSEESTESGEASITNMITKFFDRIMPQQKDTYKPKNSEIEIFEQPLPPQKGSE